MQRNFLDYAIVGFKGLAMGAADAVPGVSGGTIALIAGIYEELITTISNIDLKLFGIWRNQGFAKFWKSLNGNFIIALISGILISIITFTKIAKYLLEYYPVLIWSFFFGLVLASIFFVGKEVKRWNIPSITGLIVGAIFAYYISILPPLAETDNSLFLLLAGSLAICAMILPGISGAFILLILGAYKSVIDALHNFDIQKIGFFVLGAIIGLLSFSRVLKWLFKNYHNTTLAVLTGFIVGSLNKIWPWKKTLSWRTNSDGFDVPLVEKSVSPFNFDGEPYFMLAIILMLIGCLTIVLLEKLGNRKTIDGAN